MTVTASSAADVARLTALIARQRRELDLMRAQAAARSVVDMAQGILMERLGCSAAEASQQLAGIAQHAGTTLVDLAAEITAERLAGPGGPPANGAGTPGGPPANGAGTPGGPPANGAGTPRGLSLAMAAMQTSADGDGIAAAALDEALAPAGAAAVGLWLLGPDGRLDLVGEAGLGPRESSRWRHLAPDLDSLPQRVAHTGTEILWPAGPPADDPVPRIGAWLHGARAELPMRRSGLLTGVMSVIWPDSLPGFEPLLLQQLAALGELCAQALAPLAAGGGAAPADRPDWLYGLLDGLAESVMALHPERDPDGTVRDFTIGHVSAGFHDPAGRKPGELAGRPLLEVYPLAALPGGLFDQAVQVLATGIPQHTSGSILSLLDIRIARLFDGVVIAWRRVDEAERLASLLEHAERLGRIGGWEENLLTGELRWTDAAAALFGREPGTAIPLADLSAHVDPGDLFDLEQFRDTLLREKRATAAAFRIVRADDESVRQMRVFAEPVTGPAGALTSVRGVFQDVSAFYHTQLALTATRDRLADTEERAEEEHRLAIRLQQAITPWSAKPVAAAGLEVVARYRPAGPARLVSGDWYDTVLLPTGQVLLAVGDIAGHGIEAVTGMVEMRNCLRGFAVTGITPGLLLGWLNKVACHLTDGIVATAVCALYDPPSMTLRWARAGHLPPVLVRDGSAESLALPSGLMIGADPAAVYDEVTTQLAADDVLLLFTDGLVERRDLGIDQALAALLRAASRPAGGIYEFADRLLDGTGANTGDDACLVAVHVH